MRRSPTGRREDLLRREAEAWARIDELAGALTPEELERPGYTPDGWSVKDLMAHVAAWSEHTARVLGEMAAGTWDGEDPTEEPGRVDRLNREWFERSRETELEMVRSAWQGARRLLLETFRALGEITPDADEWFEETGPAHYAEHLPDLVAWSHRLRSEERRSGP